MRTQKGNNNAYCQDNETSWFDWDLAKKNSEMVDFFRKAIAFEKRYTILEKRKFYFDKDLNDDVPDIAWFGKDLQPPSWNDLGLRTLCYQLHGKEEGSEIDDYYLFFILNADYNLQSIELPPINNKKWYRAIDTSLKNGEDFLVPGKEVQIDPAGHYLANPRSTVVLLGK